MRNVMVGLAAVLLASTAWGQEDREEVIDLRGSKITDEVLAGKVKGLTNLKTLYLFKTKITDAGLVPTSKRVPA